MPNQDKDVAWWTTTWGAQGGDVAAQDDVVAQPAPRVTAASSDLAVADDVPIAARIPDPPTAGYVPGKDVLQPWKKRSYQGFAPMIPPTDAAAARSTNTAGYVDISYAGWKPKPDDPVPPAAFQVNRVQIPPHAVFTRPPVAVPQGHTVVYQ
jgi:hypothetical protein